MIGYIKGKLAGISPALALIDVNGVGYELNISLYTFEKIKGMDNCKLHTHLSIKEDSHTLFGFFEEEERMMFRLLINVSGVGATTARMILSSLSVAELQNAILRGDSALIKSVKGIGIKTSQKIVIDLQDKIGKGVNNLPMIDTSASNMQARSQALDALVTLGFSRLDSDKAINKILRDEPDLLIENIIKKALKTL